MIFKLLLAVAPVGVILIGSEYLWRKKIVRGERARKLIHILAGIWVAFWPFYVPFDGIFVFSSMMLVVLVYSRFTRLFGAIYDVKRVTYGDLLFAVGLMVCALLSNQDWVFTTSILFLALADGGAAVVGRFWGIKNSYHVFGYKHLRKSVAGTLTFFLLAEICVLVGYLIGGESAMQDTLLLAFIVLPLLATLFENMMPFGLDNVATPLVATLLLNSLL